jgi:hypothetical protein
MAELCFAQAVKRLTCAPANVVHPYQSRISHADTLKQNDISPKVAIVLVRQTEKRRRDPHCL